MNKHLWILFALLSLSACTSAPRKSSAGAGGDDAPKLLRPDVKKIWVPAEIRDGGAAWVEGHYIFRVEKGAVWSR